MKFLITANLPVLAALAFLGCNRIPEPPAPAAAASSASATASGERIASRSASASTTASGERVAAAASSASATASGEPVAAASASASPLELTAERHSKAKLERIELEIGKGSPAKLGDSVTVGYIGRYMNSKEFDSRDRHDPFTFTLGSDKVIQGWNEGIVGMRVGGKRRLIIPSNLAYGIKGKPPKIPPNAPLWYDVDLYRINGKP